MVIFRCPDQLLRGLSCHFKSLAFKDDLLFMVGNILQVKCVFIIIQQPRIISGTLYICIPDWDDFYRGGVLLKYFSGEQYCCTDFKHKVT